MKKDQLLSEFVFAAIGIAGIASACIGYSALRETAAEVARHTSALNALPLDQKIAELDTEHNPREISLAENAIRSGMHPADQFEAFRDLHARDGLPIEDIAARFGFDAGELARAGTIVTLDHRGALPRRAG